MLQTAADSTKFLRNDVRASWSIPSFYEYLNTGTGTLTNGELDAGLSDALTTFGAASERSAA